MSRQPKDEDLEQMSELMQNLHFPNEAAYREYLENLEKNKYKKGFKDMKEPKFAKHPKWSNSNVEESTENIILDDDPGTTIYNDEDMGIFREVRGDVAVYDNGEIPLKDYQEGNVFKISLYHPDTLHVKKVGEDFYKKLGGAWTIGGRKSRRRMKTRRKRGTKSKKRRQCVKSKRRR